MLLPGDGTDQGEYSKLMATSIAVLAQRLAAL